jgi:lycopene cyclase domain-containing protein
MSFTYLLINIFIIAVPLWYTRDERTAYYRRWSAVGFSIAVVSGAYLIWDIFVTARGEWSFNSRYLTGLRVFNLPLEEVLFFVTVPYSCLFIYEVVLYATQGKNFHLPKAAVVAASALLLAASILVHDQGYSSKSLASCALFLLAALLLDRPLLNSTQYWGWLAICYVPFLIVNSILTALPVVEYHPAAIFGLRVFTIPVEDFFYNYSMLSFYLLAYRMRRSRLAGVAG